MILESVQQKLIVQRNTIMCGSISNSFIVCFISIFAVLSLFVPVISAVQGDDDDKQSESIFLVRDGKPKAVIVIADEPLPVLKRNDVPGIDLRGRIDCMDNVYTQRGPAEKIQEWLCQASGAELPIVSASEAPDAGALILVGRSTVTEQYGLQTPTESEGVRIQTFERGVALLGEITEPGTANRPMAIDRGLNHAVSFFLEDFLDFRFYFSNPDNQPPRRHAVGIEDINELGVVIPYSETLKIPATINFETSPDFKFRSARSGYFGAELRLGRTDFMHVCHTDDAWRYTYGPNRDDHRPEYFVLNPDGSRNYRYLDYSNLDLVKQRIKNLQAYYENDGPRISWVQPGVKYIAISPADNLRTSQSDKAQEMTSDENNPVHDYDHQPAHWGRQSHMYFTHIKKVAEEVKNLWPDKRVVSLAYQGYTLPPRFELPDNVDIVLCPLAPSHLYKEPEARLRVDELVKAWHEKLGRDRERLYFWDYPCWPGMWTAAPVIYPNRKQQWLRDYSPYVAGEFLNAGGRTVQEAHWFINLWTRLLWDMDLDVEAFLIDYCNKFFGPAAEPMEKFYRLIIDRYENVEWSEHAGDYSVGLYQGLYGETYTPEVIAELKGYFNEAQVAVNAPLTIRPREVQAGDRWLQSNASRQPVRYRIELEGVGEPIENPHLKWGGGELTYQGELYEGLCLVIKPTENGMRARLYPVELTDYTMSKEEPRGGGEGRRQGGGGWVRKYARPDQEYRLQVTGRTEDDGDSWVVLYYSTGDGSWGHEFFHGSAFDADGEWVERTATFTVPNKQNRFNRIDFFRRGGKVWYANASLTPNIPEDGIDVTEYVEGKLPEIDAGASAWFELNAEKEDDQGSIRLRMVTEKSESGKSDDIYRRRVHWMRDWLEDFGPGPVSGRSGFFVEARAAHRWIDRVPEYTISRIESRPEPDFSHSSWQKAASTYLRQGQDILRYRSRPEDRLGVSADVPTRVQALYHHDGVSIAFRCSQIHAPTAEDAVKLEFFDRDKTLVEVKVKADGSITTEHIGVEAEVQVGHGWWGVFIELPKELFERDWSDPDSLRANFLRLRSPMPEEQLQGDDERIELPLPVGVERKHVVDTGEMASYTWSPLIRGGLGWDGFPWRERGIIRLESSRNSQNWVFR